MANHPKVTVFGYDPGRDKVDCMVGDDFLAVPITIRANRVPAEGEVIPGPSVWIRSSVTPYYAYPYMYGGVVASGSKSMNSSGQTAIKFRYSGAAEHFAVGDKIAVYDFSAAALSGGDTFGTVLAVSGSTNTIYLSGAPVDDDVKWPPQTNDLVFVCSGGSPTTTGTYGWIGDASSARTYDANICVVLEDIVMVKDTDQLSAGYIQGTFLKNKVKGVTYLPSGQLETARVSLVANSTASKLLNFIDLET